MLVLLREALRLSRGNLSHISRGIYPTSPGGFIPPLPGDLSHNQDLRVPWVPSRQAAPTDPARVTHGCQGEGPFPFPGEIHPPDSVFPCSVLLPSLPAQSTPCRRVCHHPEPRWSGGRGEEGLCSIRTAAAIGAASRIPRLGARQRQSLPCIFAACLVSRDGQNWGAPGARPTMPRPHVKRRPRRRAAGTAPAPCRAFRRDGARAGAGEEGRTDGWMDG